MHFVTRNTCRICGSSALTEAFSLGEQYLASTFVSDAAESGLLERKLPLDLVRCDPQKDENACGLVQLRHTFPPELIYSSYWYQSGINRTMTQHLQSLARTAEEIASLRSGDFVIDVGCNDGTLLSGYSASGVRRVGFEPSHNVAALAREKGHEVIPSFFEASAFERKFPSTKAKVITSIAMFYDLEKPNEFVADVARLLHEDGVWIGELSYLPSMLRQNSFDTICHEHLEYYHLAPLERLLAAHGLRVADLELNEVNGGSFRFYARHKHKDYFSAAARERVEALRRREFDEKLDTSAPFDEFRRSCESVRSELNALIDRLRGEGKTVAVYGASTKGNTLLQYCGLDEKRILMAADRNPIKHGKRTPGTWIPIRSEEDARRARPDYFLVLPWHFLGEFVKRETDYLASGGRFIVPLPRPAIVGPNGPET